MTNRDWLRFKQGRLHAPVPIALGLFGKRGAGITARRDHRLIVGQIQSPL